MTHEEHSCCGRHWDPEVPHFGHFFCPGGHFSKGVGLGTFFLPNLGKKNPSSSLELSEEAQRSRNLNSSSSPVLPNVGEGQICRTRNIPAVEG